jgi:hypoxanthine phosphoribosyltransferase
MTGEDDLEILFDEQALEQKVLELAVQISLDYAAKDLLVVCILKGAAIFFTDLVRRLTIPAMLEFAQVSSYESGTVSSRVVTVTKDIGFDISGKHVLLVDGIIDTGTTMDFLLTRYRERGPASLRIAVLLDKSAHRTVDVPIHYRGFEIPDRFVVGYGMDNVEKYRNLPYIAALRQK